MPEPRILIIAYGNPLRCDDGLAWRAAEKLSKLNFHGDLEIITRHQLTPELALPVSQANTVIFIDAAQGADPGEITSGPVKPQRSSSALTHDFSPSTILSVAQGLYGRCPEAFAISLCGECFDHGEVLSPKVEESLPRLVAHVTGLVQANTSLLPL
jgi:hydrogenase maturation protease